MRLFVLSFGSALLFLSASGCSCGDPPTPPDPDAGVVTSARCGDGIVEDDEECDGANLSGAECASEGFDTGQLRCGADCRFDTAGCSTCGNDEIEATEACDGDDVGGATCAGVFGAGSAGVVTCTDDCTALDVIGCADDVTLPPLAACDPEADACGAPLSCITIEAGSFCLTSCADTPTACVDGTTCASLPGAGGAGSVEVCLAEPGLSEICVAGVSCAEGDCTPMFTVGDVDVAVCAEGCAASDAFTGRGGCASGEGCVVPPASAVDLEPGDVACDPLAGNVECDVVNGYRCAELEGGAARCARYLAVCAVPRAFFEFASALPSEESLCDLAVPVAAPRLCGFSDATALVRPARVSCLALFDAVPDVGACVAVCDAAAAEDAQGELSCGGGLVCAQPASPQLFYPQAGDVPCVGGDTAACSADHLACIDFGAGEVCARAAKVCTTTGDAP